MQAGYVGLGSLGAAMAGRLREQGVDLTVWNRSPERAAAFGGPVASTPAELISRVPVVFVCLADSNAVEVVLRGQNGLLAGDCAGKLIIDTTTNHHVPVTLFHTLARQKGAAYLEAPVVGSVVPASKGALTVLVSGEPADHARAQPYLELIGARIFFMGGPGRATRMKLVNNLCLGTFMAGLAEALAVAEAAGLERETALDVLGAGAGKSLVLDAKRQKLLDEDFAPHFSVGMIHKDLHCLLDLAREVEQPVVAGAVVKELFGRAIQLGLRESDFSAVFATLRGPESARGAAGQSP